MKLIIYGEEPPKISFTQSPKGDLSFKVENERVIEIDPEQKTIRWIHLYPVNRRWKFRKAKSEEEEDKLFVEFTGELEKLNRSEAERLFFSKYVSECLNRSVTVKCWEAPALIPQVWVNWIHYDARDQKRAQRVQREPFRVDFMMKDEEISESLLIIEIDGLSHFCDFRINPVGSPIPHPSMDSFTEHIIKDRWLRKQGWQVFRVSSQEVEQCENFSDLFFDVVGKWIIDIPF
jgi:very-short-patch-repair endonuclease